MTKSPTHVLAILERLTSLKSVEVDIEKGAYYSQDSWTVTLTYRNPESIGDKVQVEGKSPNFDLAVLNAWVKLEKVAYLGLGRQVLLPPIEHSMTDEEAAEVNPDIPF